MPKKQRNKIYRKALVILRSYGKVFSFGICEIIDDLWKKNHPTEYSIYEPTVNAFYELYLFIPSIHDRPFATHPYWWATDDFQSRETALFYMIEMTK